MKASGSKLASLIIASFLLLGFIMVPVNAARSTYGFRVRLTTTTDWTRVGFEGASVALFKDKVIETSGAENLTVRAGKDLSINKASFDESKVVAGFEIYMKDVGAIGPKAFITKGDIGSTKLEFYRLDGDQSPFLTLTNSGRVEGDPENEKQSLIPKSMLPEVNLAGGKHSNLQRRVLAFYFPWYGTPDGPTGEWEHWSTPVAHKPKTGYYDSKSVDTIEKHIKQAKRNGIDAFITSWWGPNSFSDEAFEKLLDISEEMDFKVTIYFELATSKQDIIEQLSYLYDKYVESRAFLKLSEKPVIFFYGRVTNKFSQSDWNYVFSELADKGITGSFIGDGLSSKILNSFDGWHTFNPIDIPVDEALVKYIAASFRADRQGKLFAATVIPGYDDKEIRDPGFFKGRNSGQLYQRFWSVAMKSQPNWVLINSFNEWHEGTEIEPSEEYGDEYLELTRELAEKWKES